LGGSGGARCSAQRVLCVVFVVVVAVVTCRALARKVYFEIEQVWVICIKAYSVGRTVQQVKRVCKP
jgi:hypothetical protein